MPTLREVQSQFFEAITAPENVEQAPAFIVGDERRAAAQRLDIYANMYFYRLLDVLRADFPSLLAILGDDAFHNLVTDYLLAHPSTHPSLRHLGRALPGSLDEKWHRELAALEWARVECFDGPDAVSLTVEHVRANPELVAMSLRLIPCAKLLECEFAVDDAWQNKTEPARAPRTLLVWRQQVRVYHRALEADEAALLADLPPTVGLLCERVAAERPPEEAAARAFELLGRWVTDGILI